MHPAAPPHTNPEFTGADADAQASCRHVRQPQRRAGVCINHPGVFDGVCCFSTACPRTDQYTSVTTERDHQGTAVLSQEDRLPGDDPSGRGRPTQRLRLPTPAWRRR
eukprot:6146115-Pyramimonas_sp.AAC.1